LDENKRRQQLLNHWKMSTNSKLRILALEDSEIDAVLILRELKQGGIEFVSTRVETRADFAQALWDFRPEIILADYRLPNFDGGQALAMARENCPDIPVIIISGAVGEETAVELLKNGATDFVLKDRPGRLVPAVQRALREVESRNARRQAEADLRMLNEKLEQRVAERTRQLWEKNTLMEEDLEMARELQMAFLPSSFPTLPRGASEAASAVKFCSFFYPTSTVSGDLYNVVRVSETSVGVFICDVMGHGVRAALVTAMMRALEEQLSDCAHDPGQLLTEMNHSLRVILKQLGTTLFATACYFVMDIATKRLTYAIAGHPSPLLVHDATEEVEVITDSFKTGPALGLFDDNRYLTGETTVAEGDLILAFTDGLFEVENEQSQAFSEVRLRESIRKRVGLPMVKLVQDVSTEIEHFAQGREFSDDVCLIGMEITRLQARASGAA
jgi:serine phosphatase RsbU (regulator of sigma subunit)